MNSADASTREALFWELAQQLLAEPGVTQSTMMGYPAGISWPRCAPRPG